MDEKLCVMCGEEALFWCSSCHREFYCSELCQKRHWTGIHESSCGPERAEKTVDSALSCEAITQKRCRVHQGSEDATTSAR